MAASKDFAANALILAQMRPALVKYFRRKCGASDEAEDLAQDVMVRALGHANWTSAEQAKGYIFRTAVNRWRDRKRMTVTHGVNVELDEAGNLNEEVTPERVVTVEQELSLVAKALRRLDQRTRDVFLLIRLEQMKQAVVAQMLGVSVSTVEKDLVKALAHLARCARRGDEQP